MITHIKTPAFPQFRFEWHPNIAKVYLIRIGTDVGECIAEHVETHALAVGFVQTWLRGFREASTKIIAA